MGRGLRICACLPASALACPRFECRARGNYPILGYVVSGAAPLPTPLPALMLGPELAQSRASWVGRHGLSPWGGAPDPGATRLALTDHVPRLGAPGLVTTGPQHGLTLEPRP